MKRKSRLWLALIPVLLGLVLAIWQPVSLDALLDFGHQASAHPLVAVGLVLVQALLLALALPGTLMLWVVAPIYSPLVAAGLLTAGSVLGAFGAYEISRHLRGRRPPDVDAGRVVNLLRERGDFLTQLVLRVLPGFPHSVINYGAGMLGLPLLPFLAAAALGLAVKWVVYAAAVHALVEVGTGAEEFGLDSVAPLLVLALFLGMGALVRHALQTRRARLDEAPRQDGS
ncbi:VTT domain-containing protein [Ectothiorhodospira shaposhnikovii]|uniref:VTT domain-containing protein n=1 Tax=Ectothiorhodospira shaposhnikovii TaxID=1054 RepID=UPI001908CE13|nr:VTT domain-containing protein [Ectothiorhodospira shaposhnikovii]